MSHAIRDQPSPETSSSLTREDILEVFSKEPVVRVRCSLVYRLGLLLVAVAIVALVLGLATVLGGLAAIVWVSGTSFVDDLRQTGKLSFMALGVLGASAIALIFLVRPWFRGRSLADMQEVTLKRHSEPALETLISEIAERVGAPKPRLVTFNCSVNASASSQGSLFGRRLKLTIGMPLLYSLTSQQLAGIIAHELGHFSQGAGMRLTSSVRFLNYWLDRMAYGRDRLDHWLARKGKDNPVLALANFIVGKSRALLAGFSHLAHLVSCFALRQMEYDADSYEARVAGSACFAETEASMTRLALASQLSLLKLEEAWRSRRLAVDLPEFIAQEYTRQASELDEYALGLEQRKTRWFDTHPAAADRIRAAEALRAEGIFHLDEPATQLMRGLSRVSQLATQLYYELEVGLEVSPDMFCQNEIIEGEVKQRQTDNRAAHTYFCGVHGPLVPVSLSRSDLHSFFQKCQAAKPDFRGLANRVRSEAYVWREICPHLEKTHAKMHDMAIVRHKAKVGMLVDAASLGISGMAMVNEQTARELWGRSKSRKRRDLARMRPFQKAAHERLGHGLAYLFAHQRSEDGQWPELRDETLSLLEVLEQLPGMVDQVAEIGERYYPLAHFYEQALTEEQQPPPLDQHLVREADGINRMMGSLLRRYQNLTYPFEHNGGKLALTEFLTIDLDAPEDPVVQAMLWPPLLVTRCNDLYQRVMTRLARIALYVEQVADTQPQTAVTPQLAIAQRPSPVLAMKSAAA